MDSNQLKRKAADLSPAEHEQLLNNLMADMEDRKRLEALSDFDLIRETITSDVADDNRVLALMDRIYPRWGRESTMNPELITKDERPITGLVIDYNQRVQDWQLRVGKDGVTQIEPYNEFGQGEYCLWFAILTEEGVGRRVNGRYVVEVCYEE